MYRTGGEIKGNKWKTIERAEKKWGTKGKKRGDKDRTYRQQWKKRYNVMALLVYVNEMEGSEGRE